MRASRRANKLLRQHIYGRRHTGAYRGIVPQIYVFMILARFLPLRGHMPTERVPLLPISDLPPGTMRYLDIDEGSPFDEAQFGEWVLQASRLPGERL